jgi:hypothetical protein
MEGKRDEVLAAKAKAHEERNKGSSNAKTSPSGADIRHDSSGRAYIVDSETGEAILLAATADSTPSPDVALAALSTDSIPDEWYNGSSHEIALLMEEHSASVDWRKRRRNISLDIFLS